jgi:hypothetical protein
LKNTYNFAFTGWDAVDIENRQTPLFYLETSVCFSCVSIGEKKRNIMATP